MQRTVSELVMEYFTAHPNEEFEHGPVVDWVTAEWLRDHKTPPRDPWRVIRHLHSRGILIKVRKGVYKYDPSMTNARELEDFTPEQKAEIFKRDNYRCVICRRGTKDGVEIHADHIIPRELGGRAEVSNGQTLCSVHNFRKKTYQQTETGKRMFIRLYELAKAKGDAELRDFAAEVLNLYVKHGVNDHIEWNQ